MDKKEQSKARSRRYRDAKKTVTQESVTLKGEDSVTLLKRPNGHDYNPEELLPDGRKRYMNPCHDGQVLDRTTVPYLIKDNVGTKSGQHPFYGMNSVIFTPTKS